MHQIINNNRISNDTMKTLGELFKEDSDTSVPEGLFEQVLFRIQAEDRKLARREQFAWGGIFVASLGLFVESGIRAAHVIAASNFGSYLSLAFSDSSMIGTLWKQFALSLVESFPFIETIVFLASIVAVLWSIRNFLKKTPFFITQPNAHIA